MSKKVMKRKIKRGAMKIVTCVCLMMTATNVQAASNMEYAPGSTSVIVDSLHTTMYKVTAKSATLYSGPGKSYSSVGTVKKHSYLDVYSVSNGWAKLKIRGNWCYISTGSIRKV